MPCMRAFVRVHVLVHVRVRVQAGGCGRCCRIMATAITSATTMTDNNADNNDGNDGVDNDYDDNGDGDTHKSSRNHFASTGSLAACSRGGGSGRNIGTPFASTGTLTACSSRRQHQRPPPCSPEPQPSPRHPPVGRAGCSRQQGRRPSCGTWTPTASPTRLWTWRWLPRQVSGSLGVCMSDVALAAHAGTWVFE